MSVDGRAPSTHLTDTLTLRWVCSECGWTLYVEAPGFAGDGQWHYPDGRTACGPISAQRSTAFVPAAGSAGCDCDDQGRSRDDECIHENPCPAAGSSLEGEALEAPGTPYGVRWYVPCGCDHHGDHLGCEPTCSDYGCQHPVGVNVTAETEGEADAHVHGPSCWPNGESP